MDRFQKRARRDSNSSDSGSDAEVMVSVQYTPQRHNAHMMDIDALWSRVTHKHTSYELRESLQGIVDELFLNPPSQSPTRLHDVRGYPVLAHGTMTNVLEIPERHGRVIRLNRHRIDKVEGRYILCKHMLEIIIMKMMAMYMPRHAPDVHSFGFLHDGSFFIEVDRIHPCIHKEEVHYSPFQLAIKSYVLTFLRSHGLRMLDCNKPSNWACVNEMDLVILDLNDVDVLPLAQTDSE